MVRYQGGQIRIVSFSHFGLVVAAMSVVPVAPNGQTSNNSWSSITTARAIDANLCHIKACDVVTAMFSSSGDLEQPPS